MAHEIRQIGPLLRYVVEKRGKRREVGQREVVVVMVLFRVGDAFMSTLALDVT